MKKVFSSTKDSRKSDFLTFKSGFRTAQMTFELPNFGKKITMADFHDKANVLSAGMCTGHFHRSLRSNAA